MRYVSAYMLAAMGAKHHHITAHDIESILGSVGVICQREKAEEVVKRMHGKTLEELIEEGAKYLSMSAVPATAAIVGGASAKAPVSADTKGGDTDAASTDAKKKEEKEKEEESDDDLGFGIFD